MPTIVGSSITQVLTGVSLQPNTTYVLSVAVGMKDTANVVVQLDAGGAPLTPSSSSDGGIAFNGFTPTYQTFATGDAPPTGHPPIPLGLSGANTLSIDGGLRRGALREDFDIQSKIGFSEVLKQEVNWREVVVPTSLPSLFVLPRGNPISQPSEHLLR